MRRQSLKGFRVFSSSRGKSFLMLRQRDERELHRDGVRERGWGMKNLCALHGTNAKAQNRKIIRSRIGRKIASHRTLGDECEAQHKKWLMHVQWSFLCILQMHRWPSCAEWEAPRWCCFFTPGMNAVSALHSWINARNQVEKIPGHWKSFSFLREMLTFFWCPAIGRPKYNFWRSPLAYA